MYQWSADRRGSHQNLASMGLPTAIITSPGSRTILASTWLEEALREALRHSSCAPGCSSAHLGNFDMWLHMHSRRVPSRTDSAGACFDVLLALARIRPYRRTPVPWRFLIRLSRNRTSHGSLMSL